MKQLLFVILVICILLLICCQSEPFTDNSQNTEPPFLDATWQNNINPPETTTADTNSATEERSDTTTPTQAVSPETTEGSTEGMTKNDNEQSAPTETEPKATTPPPTTDTKPKDAEEPQPTTEAAKPTDPPVEETKPSATFPTEQEEPKATAADVYAIASKMVELLNGYRTEQGSPAATVLPGLTQYAEYRSRQLVSNFAHDTSDECAAATALAYGTYIDPSVYGMSGDPYYTANAREAIAKTDFGGSVDAVAARLARMARNSSSHWSYLGSAGYTYIGVGITYKNGIWYCDIAVTETNTDAQ